ncbi:site-specific integrase [Paenibacillus sp. V4I7]|uniref:tyrosine-type recombinase/integrase n=1 Tax=Paenibacillus sp. V4I7 TaxID=3042307 RepID=UPI002786279B|nr:site-specific integrase [Paenibacillus sp. V4I7]MDQ0897473.1 site-specific recombinase XerD [Paenibacillus sp. V4I7]
MTLKELWVLYEADKRILGFSMHTMKAYFLQLNMLIRELGNLEIEEISLNMLKDYFARVSERLKPSSLGHRIRFVHSLFRFAFEEGHMTRNPSLKLREPKMDKCIPKFLVEEDVIHLKITCHSHREHALLEFLYCTGCRVGEVQKINIEDVNWENCSAIREKDNEDFINYVSSMNDQQKLWLADGLRIMKPDSAWLEKLVV